MTEKVIQANGLDLVYEEFGDPKNPSILLIMGLGTQMIAWPEQFCQGLADNGFHVVRYDNRDIGLSQKMSGAGVPFLPRLLLSSALKFPPRVPYTLHNMAADAVGLMDALNIKAAHIVGVSMGGMIAQLVASDYPGRTLSMTSIMSSSGARNLPRSNRKISRQMARRPRVSGEQAYIENSIRMYQLIGSPAYMPSETELREKAQRSYQRSYHPQGYARHLAAIIASGSRVNALAKISAPALVIHGKSDALVPVEAGIDTANRIANAKLELFDGMGHDLPAPLLPQFVSLITEHAQST